MHDSKQPQASGVIPALAAFTFWGVAPIYFKWLGTVGDMEIIAHRIIWSVLSLVLFLLLRDGPRFWRRMQLPPKTIAGLCISATLVASNWFLFVWAVNRDHVLDTSLGYFITPLINVLLGMLFLHERLSRTQWLAISLAAAGTIYLAWYLGVTPWIPLAIAVTFGLYGLVRKKLNAGPMIGLLWETLLLIPVALVYLIWLVPPAVHHFANDGVKISLLLVGSGAVTVLPLVWFNMAAKRMTLSTLGFFQYLGPCISFLMAVFLFKEPFTPGHMVTFSLIWIALALVSTEPLFRARRIRLPT
jgi:chloramphenicol-sensitive protein RarD